MRQAQIYRKNILVGLLTEKGGEYIFRYDSDYLTSPKAAAISLTLPLQQEAYTSPVLFSILRWAYTRRVVARCGATEYRHSDFPQREGAEAKQP